jgi:predicted dehydrogenase
MIHVAILGAGIGREHLAAFRALKDRFTVRAVVDQDLERIEDIRQDGDSFSALRILMRLWRTRRCKLSIFACPHICTRL